MKFLKKKSQAVKINGTDLTLNALPISVLFKLKELKSDIAIAVSNLTVNPNYSAMTQKVDKKNEISTVSEEAPSENAVKDAVSRRHTAIVAIAEILLDSELLGDVLRASVKELSDIEDAFIFGTDGMDIPTCIELLIAIIELNIEGFSRLGKLSSLLNPLKSGTTKEG